MEVQEFFEIILGSLLLFFQIIYSVFETGYRYCVPLKLKPVKGEIVLITGSGNGIGKELALLYASHGATVVGWDIDIEKNEETIEEINKSGHPKAYAYYCDVSNRDQVLEVANKVKLQVGDVNILINNAGIMPAVPVLEHSETDIHKVFSINVLSHLWTIQAFLPAMKKNNHGHIVALSSCTGLFGIPYLVAYSATKFAVFGMMESLSEEFRTTNTDIQVTTVCPYIVDTGLCKRPKVRFQSLMPYLLPKVAAEMIMEAQRSNQVLLAMPWYFETLNNCSRLLPSKAQCYIRDFLRAGVEPDH